MQADVEPTVTEAPRLQRAFVVAWALLVLAKLWLAVRVPLFVDEAFYWQEGRHLAWAYSDLPGLTAWLARAGEALFGHAPWAIRLPFEVVAAWLPWQVVWLARRVVGARASWHAGLLALLLPLVATLGVLALPDVVLALAGVLALTAFAGMLRSQQTAQALAWGDVTALALALVLGGLSHYRFLSLLGVGLLALLAVPEGRGLLRERRWWLALLPGILAWVPLLAWNLAHAEAGWRFQFIDRHPWHWHADGGWFVPIQAMLVTPLVFVGLLAAGIGALRARASAALQGWLAMTGLGYVAVFFVLGFFADSERVSFHWPLPGWLALVPLLAAWLPRWWRSLRVLLWLSLLLAALASLAGLGVLGLPALRERALALGWLPARAYPDNFIGWTTLADAVRDELARMPPGTRLLADDFKLGAELGFALDDPRITVLPNPLNDAHGRSPQLALWGLLDVAPGAGTRLLVLNAGGSKLRALLPRYHALCRLFGPLPPPHVVALDHGQRRLLLLPLPAAPGHGACTTPAIAWLDAPAADARVRGDLRLRGWAIKDGVGLSGVDVTLDGRVVAQARYGLADPGVADYWRISTDPQHPKVGFEAMVPASDLPAGPHWLGLLLHGRDGSVEEWSAQRVWVESRTPANF
jgi:4-amino-4-deoxy-L-arabinose transferase-like glycosyltransferase